MTADNLVPGQSRLVRWLILSHTISHTRSSMIPIDMAGPDQVREILSKEVEQEAE